MSTDTNPKRPADHVRIGFIQAAIWPNPTESGTRFGVTLERLYRDQATDAWRSTSSFGRDDLLILAKVADRAHSRILELQAAERGNRPDRDGPDGSADAPESEPTPPAPVAGGTRARRNGRGSR